MKEECIIGDRIKYIKKIRNSIMKMNFKMTCGPFITCVKVYMNKTSLKMFKMRQLGILIVHNPKYFSW